MTKVTNEEKVVLIEILQYDLGSDFEWGNGSESKEELYDKLSELNDSLMDKVDADIINNSKDTLLLKLICMIEEK